jgi:beta-glucosidase-like glycosyl hydrolase
MLTQNLREALAHSRAVLDDWVEQELQAADAQAVTAANKVSQKQHEIDAASAKLLALQLESGLSMNDENSNNNTENLANALVKRKQLEQQVENQKVKNSKLEATLEEQKKELEGTNFLIIVFHVL